MEGIDFGDIFSPIAKLILLYIFSIIDSFDIELDQMGVETIFLHVDIEE